MGVSADLCTTLPLISITGSVEESRSPDGHINRNFGIIYHMMRLTDDQALMVEVDQMERVRKTDEQGIERRATRCPVCQALPTLTDDWSYGARGNAVVYFVCATPACNGRTIPLELDHDEAVRALLSVPGPGLTLF